MARRAASISERIPEEYNRPDEEIEDFDDIDEEDIEEIASRASVPDNAEYYDDDVDAETLAIRRELGLSIGYDDEDADDLFGEGIYLAVPRIPEDYRASDIIGKRTQASSASTAMKIGPIRPKSKLRAYWENMNDLEKYILMLISEHRHLTQQQLGVLIIGSTKMRNKNGAHNSLKAYYEWVTKEKYCVLDMNYKNTFKTSTHRGLEQKLSMMCEDGLIEKVTPAYSVDDKKISERYKATPSLFTEHYYLTVLGAKILICNTAANRTTSKEKPVGFVPTYRNAAYQTILHEAESTEVLCSLISCAQYASNPDDGKDYGRFDICRFYHEKDVEEKGVVYKNKKIDFKSDGKLTMYVESIGDFLDFYIEYDSGSSTKDKIKHKTEAFIKYIFWKRNEHGDRFRRPVLLLVSQKPADLFPQLSGRQSTTYTTGIKNMAKTCFEEHLHKLNDIAVVLVADCGSIRTQGALGACWHRVDLRTGIAGTTAYDLITAATLPFSEINSIPYTEEEEDRTDDSEG